MILGIYGTGGQGRETLVLAQQIVARTKRWPEIFFIDDYAPGRELKGVDVISFEEVAGIEEDVEFVVAVGEPATRELLADKVRVAGYALATLIHPDVYIPACAKVGEGAIVGVGTFVSSDVTIGENALLQPHCSVWHDVEIGAHAVVSGYASVAGACKVGARAYIGMNAVIREKVTVGDDAIVGMSAAVLKNIPSGAVAYGNPARIVRENIEKKVFKS